MTGCGGAATVETCHMAVSAIAQLPRQRVAGGGMLGCLEFHGRLGTVWSFMDMQCVMLHGGFGYVRPRAVDSGLMR
jgi:hypothetical protein